MQDFRTSAQLPPLGEDRVVVIHDKAVSGIIRHGTSLNLMSKASVLINDEFNSDPQKDWEKWSERKGFSLYYALFENANGEALCALRAILDGVLDENRNDTSSEKVNDTGNELHRPKRFIIDYIHTKLESRGVGLATLLTKFSLSIAKSTSANVLVLSLEDAASYWMQNNFILEESKRLNNRLNVFSDTYLLKLDTNVEDPGEIEDDNKRDNEEEIEEMDAIENQSESFVEDDSDNDQELQIAIIKSMQKVPIDLTEADAIQHTESGKVMSIEQQSFSVEENSNVNASSSVTNQPIDLTEGNNGDFEDATEEEELQRALLMSIQER